jgi:radical SAM protein with 4Fe4S-binding SPASM domain
MSAVAPGDWRREAMLVVLLPTLECNLACRYCFEDHPAGRWDAVAVARVLEEIFAVAAGSTRRVRLHWQGGEPLLLGRGFFANAFAIAEARAAAAGVALEQSMQTNLVAYDSTWRDLVAGYLGGRLGTSFEDGDGRAFAAGGEVEFRGAWSRAFGRARADGIDVGVLSLLDEAALARGAERTLDALRDRHGVTRLRFTTPFAPGGAGRGGYWVDPRAAGAFLAEAYRVWARRGRDEWMRIRPFALLAAMLRGERPREPATCVFDRNCAEIAFCVLPDGDVTLCDNLARREGFPPFGNLLREPLAGILAGARRAELRRAVAQLADDACGDCRYLSLCHGGCLAKSTPAAVGGAPRYRYCAAFVALCRAIEEGG